MLGITTTNARVGGFRGGVSAEAKIIYNRIIADGGVSNLTRLNFFVKGLKAIYGDLANVPVCYDAHWIGYKLGSGTGATAGQAAAKLYSLTVAGDAVQSTAASQPLLLSHNGASSDNYWYGSGVAGNYCSIASQTALKFNADFSVVVNIESYKANTNMELAGSSDGWASFAIGFTGLLKFDFALTTYNSTTTLPANTKWIRFSANGTGLLFYTSIDGITWTQLGLTVTMGARSTPPSVQIFAGNGSANISLPLNGKINRIKYYTDSALTTLVYDFNPNLYNTSVSQTQFTASTSEIWTINTGTAATGYKGQLVSKTIVMSDGVDDTLVMPSNVGLIAPVTLYTSFRGYSDDGGTGKSIFGYSNIDVAISRFNLSNIVAWFGNGGSSSKLFTLAGISDKILLAMAIRRNGTCELSVNNATPVTGTQATAIVDGKIGVSVSGFSNATFRTGVVISGADNATNQTAMYNLIRSLNENAF